MFASRSSPGVGRNAVPVRSAILGAALAVMVLVATVTFGASLHSLVSHPAPLRMELELRAQRRRRLRRHPPATGDPLLNHDPYVQAWSGAYFDDLTSTAKRSRPRREPRRPVQPPILSGHGSTAADQVVLGAITLAQLHKHVGDSVTFRTPAPARRQLQIVGTATMPTIGGPGPHLEMGIGAARCLHR